MCIYKNDIITPQSYYHHNFTISPLMNGPNSLINNTQEDLEDLETQIKTVIKEQNDSSQVKDIEQFKCDLGIMALQVDKIYQILSVNLLPSLLKCHDKSGNELHKNMFNSKNLQKYDCVFDPETYKKTGYIRASLYTIMYISKDHKSVLIAKPQTNNLCQSKYPNSKSSSTDRYYNQANLHLKYMCRDTASDFVSFDPG